MRDTRLDSARAKFDAAEKNLTRLQQRLADASQKLLKAVLDVAGIDRKIEAFATTIDADPVSAAHLVGERETARNVALLLEQAEAFLESEAAKAKAAVIDAEMAIRTAQVAALGEQIEVAEVAVIRSAAKPVADLMKLLNLSCHLRGLISGQAEGSFFVEGLFGPSLQHAVKAHWPETEEGRAELIPSPTEMAALARASDLISREERDSYRKGGLAALLPDSAEPEPTNDDFTVDKAVGRIRDARDRIDELRYQVAHHERGLNVRPGDPNHLKYIEHYKAEIATWEGNVKRMEDDLRSRGHGVG